MFRVQAAGYEPVLSVHDEIVTEAPKDHGSVEHFRQLMSVPPDWAKGCPINASGYRADRYRK
jgi:DNA polymerase